MTRKLGGEIGWGTNNKQGNLHAIREMHLQNLFNFNEFGVIMFHWVVYETFEEKFNRDRYSKFLKEILSNFSLLNI